MAPSLTHDATNSSNYAHVFTTPTGSAVYVINAGGFALTDFQRAVHELALAFQRNTTRTETLRDELIALQERMKISEVKTYIETLLREWADTKNLLFMSRVYNIKPKAFYFPAYSFLKSKLSYRKSKLWYIIKQP